MFYNKKGFTLIELLVVIAVIGVLSSIVLVSLSGVRGKARDAIRQSDMSQIRKALEVYYTDHGHYPSTGSIKTTYCDLGCTGVCGHASARDKWIPDLVEEGYFAELPRDPNPKDQARGSSRKAACYMYASDGNKYILSAWATVETGPISVNHGFYSRAGFREVSICDQFYLCNHPNIGNPAWGDYYKYSYTITSDNLGCSW